MLGRFRMVDYQTPIKLGDVRIQPGDVIFGDIDGVLLIPRAIACDVLLRAEGVRKEEQVYKGWIDKGMSATEGRRPWRIFLIARISMSLFAVQLGIRYRIIGPAR